MKLCWLKNTGCISYGWDDCRKTTIIKNSVSLALMIRGWHIGISFYNLKWLKKIISNAEGT